MRYFHGLIIRWSQVRALVGPQNRPESGRFFLYITIPACYILYSQSHDRYYIGATHDDVSVRLIRHNKKAYDSKVTAYTGDLQAYLVLECTTYTLKPLTLSAI